MTMRVRPLIRTSAVAAMVALTATACGSSSPDPNAASTTSAPGSGVNPNAPEVVAPGDIPDTQAFVQYTGAGFAFKVPEGWSQSNVGGTTTFTDHYNTVTATVAAQPAAPTGTSAQTGTVSMLKRDVPNFELVKVGSVSRPAGPTVLITYRAGSPPDPVTGKRVAIDAERYEFWSNGRQVTLTLSGARGSDNVDPWRTITDSFAWTP